MRPRSIVLVPVLAAALASGCAKAHAKVAPEAPLDVPPPPPRIVEPIEGEAPPPVPLVTEPARHATPAPAHSRPAESPRQEPPKTEKPAEPPPATEPPKVEDAPKPAPAPTTLQTTPTQAEGEVERGIRSVLGKAQDDLSRVDYRRLNHDARTQYDQAKRLIQQADDALHARNLVFAKSIADKAATIAAQLAGR